MVSEDQNSLLTKTNSSIKQNLKTWISQYKMISDTVDILDARIVNYGIDFEIVTATDQNKYDVLNSALRSLGEIFGAIKQDIGESIKISDIFTILSNVDGVIDVSNMVVRQLSTSGYEQTPFKFDQHRSPDGRYILAPEDVIFELRYPSLDIRGSVK